MFALADCNNFYASCEEVFNPKLSRFPLVILSNNDGCIIARSKKAKALGIKMGEPAYLYKDRAQRGEIRMLSSNFTLYADMSERVMQVLEGFSPEMEIYSIDEAFFSFEDESDESVLKKAIQMRQKVKQWTGIPISIGIGPTKTLAKVANELAKKQEVFHGVCSLISPNQIRSTLEKMPTDEIWGIGSALAHRLKEKRIYTAAQLIDSPDALIQKTLGVVGYRTVLELRGISCFSCNESLEKRKSIVCSRSFKHPLTNPNDIAQAVASFVSRAAEKLRDQKSRAQFLSVFIATSPFIAPYESRACHINLPHPTSYTPELIRFAKDALAQIIRPNLLYKKVGVMLGHFCDDDIEQFNLFGPSSDSPKKTNLMKTMDSINRRYDKNAIHFAAEGMEDPLNGARTQVSSSFTTSWNGLLKVP